MRSLLLTLSVILLDPGLQQREANPEKRKEIIRQAVTHIADKAPGLALFYETTYHTRHSYAKSYAPHWGVDGPPLTSAWLEK